MQQCLSLIRTSANPGQGIVQEGWAFFKPFHKLHNESTVDYATRELFIFLSKLVVTGAMAYAATQLVVTAPPLLAVSLITGIFLACFQKQIANYLPKKVTIFANNFFLKASLVAVPTLMLISRVFTPLTIAAAVYIAGSLIHNFIREPVSDVEIGLDVEMLKKVREALQSFAADNPAAPFTLPSDEKLKGESLDLETIQQDLQALLKDKRIINHLEIHHTGENLTLSPEIIETIKKLNPQKITLSGIQFGGSELEEINRSLIAQVQDQENGSFAFYYFYSDFEKNTVLKRADIAVNSNTLIIEYGGNGCQNVPYYSSNYITQLILVRALIPIHQITVNFKKMTSAHDDHPGDEAIRLLKKIAGKQPMTVTFDNGYFLTNSFFDELSKLPNAKTSLSPSKLKIRLNSTG